MSYDYLGFVPILAAQTKRAAEDSLSGGEDMFAKKTVILIIMDSVGQENCRMPDVTAIQAHTLNHIFERYPQMNLPNLSSLGLASISGVKIAPFRGRVGSLRKNGGAFEGKIPLPDIGKFAGLRWMSLFALLQRRGFRGVYRGV